MVCVHTSVFLTIVSLRGRVSPVVGLACRASLSVAAVLAVVAAVVVAGLGVFFQFLGQVGPRRAGGNVVFVAILRNLQLLDETHRPERQPEGKEAVFVSENFTPPFSIPYIFDCKYNQYVANQYNHEHDMDK